MGFWKSLFGGGGQDATENKQKEEEKNFDILKFDGVRASRLGRLDYALRCFDEALKLKEDLETLNFKSGTLIRAGRLEEAVSVLERMAVLEPLMIETHLTKANLEFMLEHYEDMQQSATQAVQCDPENSQAHLLLAKSLGGLALPQQAIEELSKAIGLKGDLTEARNLRAEMLYQQGQAAQAMDDLTQVLSQQSDDDTALLLRAQIYRQVEKDPAKAEADYRHIIETDPFERQAYEQLTSLLVETGREEEARQLQAEAEALNLSDDESLPTYQIGGMEKRDVLGL